MSRYRELISFTKHIIVKYNINTFDLVVDFICSTKSSIKCDFAEIFCEVDAKDLLVSIPKWTLKKLCRLQYLNISNPDLILQHNMRYTMLGRLFICNNKIYVKKERQ